VFKNIPFLLLLCSFELFADSLKLPPQANDDYASVIVGINPSATGNLSANDRYGSIVTINGFHNGPLWLFALSDTVGSYNLYALQLIAPTQPWRPVKSSPIPLLILMPTRLGKAQAPV